MDKSSHTFRRITATLSLNLSKQRLTIMPKNSAKRNKPVQEVSSPELTDIETKEEEKRLSRRSVGKRSYELPVKEKSGADCVPDEGPSHSGDYGNNLRKMLETVGADFNKCRQTKKQRLELYTTNVTKLTETKIKEMRKFQERDRKKLHDDYQKNVSSILEEWDEFISHSNEQEEKMIKIIQQQMKMIQQHRSSQVQRLAAIRQMHESYYKSYLELEQKQAEECTSNQLELRKDLNKLQEQMIEEANKEDLVQMKKYFQNMLFM